MDKLDSNLLGRIEEVFNLKFEEWQKNYLLDIPMVLNMRITGRRTGKTFVYILKLLFEGDKPIRAYDFNELADLSDWFSYSIGPHGRVDNYTRHFYEDLINIYTRLISNNINPRRVIDKRDSLEKLKCQKESDVFFNFPFKF